MTNLKLKVTAKIGDTHHRRLGTLVKGDTYEIELGEFGDELFEPEELIIDGTPVKLEKVDQPVGLLLAGIPYSVANKKTKAAGSAAPGGDK